MPWKESSVMDDRMRFVIRLKNGESMASLCREFGISRKTSYKISERYEECSLEGMSDWTRRPGGGSEGSRRRNLASQLMNHDQVTGHCWAECRIVTRQRPGMPPASVAVSSPTT